MFWMTFLFITNTMCLQTQIVFTMCSNIGVPILFEKCCGPNKVITYLGYELDSTNMECTHPKK